MREKIYKRYPFNNLARFFLARLGAAPMKASSNHTSSATVTHSLNLPPCPPPPFAIQEEGYV